MSCSRSLPHRRFADRVRPSHRFGSEYAGTGPGVIEHVLAPLVAVAANAQVNRAARCRVPVAGSQTEAVVYRSPRLGTECDESCKHAPHHRRRDSVLLRLSSFVGLEHDFRDRCARDTRRSGRRTLQEGGPRTG